MRGRVYSALLIIISFVLFSCNPPDEEVVYDYSLADINDSSLTYGNNIGPGYFENQVTVHYFGHQSWGLCKSLVGNLDALYQDLLNEGINDVRIIAIGKGEYSDHSSEWIFGNSIPIVIDSSSNNLWNTWGAEQRDLFFLDANGNYVTNFNISTWNYNKVYNKIKDLFPE